MSEEIAKLLDEAERMLVDAVPVEGQATGPAMMALQEAGVAMGRAQLLLLRAFQEQVLHPVRIGVNEAGQPLLGYATTRQLLEEIGARGKSEHYYRALGDEMAIGAADLMDRMPGSMLDYRTVGSE